MHYAAQIMAGFCANPSVFAARADCGWSLCNCTDDDLADYAVRLADKLAEADRMIPAVASTDDTALRSAAEKALAALDKVSLAPETWDKLNEVVDAMNALRSALNGQPKTK